jgi:hypothetical protein
MARQSKSGTTAITTVRRKRSPSIARGKEVNPATYFMRTRVRLETGDARYAWVNRTLFAGTGAHLDGQVVVSFFALD